MKVLEKTYLKNVKPTCVTRALSSRRYHNETDTERMKNE